MIRIAHKKGFLFWILALSIVLRTLVVPGLTPVIDEKSSLGINIVFCENLFTPIDPHDQTNTGSDHVHDHDHGNNDSDSDHSDIIPFSNHCSVSFVGGIYIEIAVFDVAQYLQQVQEQYTQDYSSPYTRKLHYRIQSSRGPPQSSVV